MKILILGGTVFLGRHLVYAALARGHEVTLFNRGRSSPELFPDIERLTGDRRADLAVLAGRRWDAVLDTCGYTPATVRTSAEALSRSVGLYVFVSSISVYRSQEGGAGLLAGIDEHAAVGTLTEDQVREAESKAAGEGVNAPSLGAMYGPLKALCEQTIEAKVPGRVLQIRPGLIVGPDDYSGRFTYWVRRVANGGEVLAPGRPGRRIRCIDVRDLAEWIVRRVEAGDTGVYNTTGSPRGWTMGRMLEQCRAVSGSDASFTWVGERFLEEQNVKPWSELPLWLPEGYNGFFEVCNDRAIAAGLTFRTLAETVRDTLAWDRVTSLRPISKTGLDPAVERRLLSRFPAD